VKRAFIKAFAKSLVDGWQLDGYQFGTTAAQRLKESGFIPLQFSFARVQMHAVCKDRMYVITEASY
jgi:hypothetical protein